VLVDSTVLSAEQVALVRQEQQRRSISGQHTVGHFEIIEKIGAGGMGEVYRARDTKLGREVAVKILPERFAADPRRLARFRREAQAVAKLNHPGIVTLFSLEERVSMFAESTAHLENVEIVWT